MAQTHDGITQSLAERLCWEVARRDDLRIARRLYRKQVEAVVYRLAEGAVLDDFLHFLQAIGVMTLLEETNGATIHRQMALFIHYVRLYGVKTLFGIESINGLHSLLFSDEVLMQLVGFNAQQVPRASVRAGRRHGKGSGCSGRCARTLWPRTS
jgi:hypothetical protein